MSSNGGRLHRAPGPGGLWKLMDLAIEQVFEAARCGHYDPRSPASALVNWFPSARPPTTRAAGDSFVPRKALY